MGYNGLPFEGLPSSAFVFPLHTPVEGGCSCRRSECRNIGKHPRTMNGVKDATNDLHQVRQWWQSWPDANVGIACGPSKLVVLDIDPRHGGDEALRDLVYGRDWPDTPTAITGGGGQHYYFRAPEGTPIRNSSGVLGPGIDVRGDGGYVVAPPSSHASGRTYEWEAGLAPGEVKAASLPQWVIDLLTSNPTRRQHESTAGQIIPEGHRDQALTSLAGTMRRRGMTAESIEAALLAENRARCVPPLPDADVRRIARSVARYPAAAEFPIVTGVTSFRQLRKVTTTPPTYRLEINGVDIVDIKTNQLLNYTALRNVVMEQLDVLLPPMKPTEWSDQLSALLVDLVHLPAPEDASDTGVIWHEICAFLTDMRVEDEDRFSNGRPVAIGNHVYTTGNQLRGALKQRGLIPEQRRIWGVFSSHGGQKKNIRINGRQQWAWELALETLEHETQEEAKTE